MLLDFVLAPFFWGRLSAVVLPWLPLHSQHAGVCLDHPATLRREEQTDPGRQTPVTSPWAWRSQQLERCC